MLLGPSAVSRCEKDAVMKRVLITGSNGFIGRYLCTDLLGIGWEVRGGIRRPEAARELPQGVEPFLVPEAGSHASSWSSALAGVDVVVHLVGRTHILRDGEADPLVAYRAINVGGTQCLLRACVRAGIQRFIYLSSIKAVGEGSEDPYDETSPCVPEDAYGITKREAEIAVLETIAETGLQSVILRPPLVYGPGVKGNFLRLLRLVDRGIPFPLGCTHNARSMVFVANLASAIAALFDQPAMKETLFHITDDGEPLSTKDLVTRLGCLLGRRVRHVPIPVPFLRLGGTLIGCSGEVRRLVGSLTVSAERLKRALSWTPPYTVEQGLAETAAWYRTARKKEKS